MKEENECEIVQDLLLSYNDNVLNESSKKLVEEHLKTCKTCQEKLQEIKKDSEKEKEFTKEDIPEVDYLKKYRRNSTIKAIVSPIIIILLILIGIYIYKFSIINGLVNKYANSLKSDNFYIEEISIDQGKTTEGKDAINTTKKWYKNGKYKIETNSTIEYGTIGEDYKVIINKENKTASKEYGAFTHKDKSGILTAPNPIGTGYQTWLLTLGTPFYWNIRKDSQDIGRMYYVIESNDPNHSSDSELWVDMETGLPIMQVGYSCTADYYENTHIVRNMYVQNTEYKYEFDIVKDEDVEVPDLSNYTTTEVDWNEEVERLKNEKN